MLQRGKITEDSSFAYALPYPYYTAPLVVQGYYGSFSHRNRAAIDFKLRQGTPVLAARRGIVVRTESRNNRGGINKSFRKLANYIVIQHEDGSRAGYWHLKKNGVFVEPGDSVLRGQVIGLSGKTGYSAFAHLHFLVWTNKTGSWQPVPTRFETARGKRYLRPWRRYRVPEELWKNREFPVELP